MPTQQTATMPSSNQSETSSSSAQKFAAATGAVGGNNQPSNPPKSQADVMKMSNDLHFWMQRWRTLFGDIKGIDQGLVQLRRETFTTGLNLTANFLGVATSYKDPMRMLQTAFQFGLAVFNVKNIVHRFNVEHDKKKVYTGGLYDHVNTETIKLLEARGVDSNGKTITVPGFEGLVQFAMLDSRIAKDGEVNGLRDSSTQSKKTVNRAQIERLLGPEYIGTIVGKTKHPHPEFGL